MNLRPRLPLLQASMPHSTVVVWLQAGLSAASADGRLVGGDPVRLTLLAKLTELRATCAGARRRRRARPSRMKR